MREVLDIIEHLPQGSQAMFLFHPKGSLGGKTPLEALALGLFDEVKQSAEGFVER